MGGIEEMASSSVDVINVALCYRLPEGRWPPGFRIPPESGMAC